MCEYATPEFLECFWQKVDKRSECWIWTGGKSGSGYGNKWDGKKVRGTHCISYEIHHNTMIPKSLQVCHTCDVRDCVNPSHLFLGTANDNMKDKVAKGRQARLKGEAHGNSKLTDGQVLSIKQELQNDTIHSCVCIAKKYGVSRLTISDIKLGRTWKHINLPAQILLLPNGESRSSPRSTS